MSSKLLMSPSGTKNRKTWQRRNRVLILPRNSRLLRRPTREKEKQINRAITCLIYIDFETQ